MCLSSLLTILLRDVFDILGQGDFWLIYLKTLKIMFQYLPFPLNMYALCVFGWERSLVATIANIEVVHFLLHYKPRSSAVFSFNQKDREEQQRKKRCLKGKGGWVRSCRKCNPSSLKPKWINFSILSKQKNTRKGYKKPKLLDRVCLNQNWDFLCKVLLYSLRDLRSNDQHVILRCNKYTIFSGK